MPKPPLPPRVAALLRGPNPAVISTIHSDGGPMSVASWYELQDDGRILVSMDAARKRLAYLRADPRVSLTVLDPDDDWHISIRGEVVELGDDEGLRDIDRLAQRYMGRPFEPRDRPRVNAWIAPRAWHGWGLEQA